VEFFSNTTAIYTKWCAQTFPPIWRLFAIFDRNFVKIAAPPSDEYENYVLHLKEESPVKKTLQTASKSGNKRQRNACSNYAPLERTVSK